MLSKVSVDIFVVFKRCVVDDIVVILLVMAWARWVRCSGVRVEETRYT